MSFVLDTSVATKLFLDEPDSRVAQDRILAAQTLVAPSIFKIELTSACIVQWRKVGLRKTDIGIQILYVNAFLAPANLSLFPDSDYYDEAVELAILSEHRVADCLFVALARRLNLPLLTADKRQAQIAASFDVELIAFP